MCLDGKNIFTWMQCQTCGAIYQVRQEIPIDKMYVGADCPHCGVTTGLNLGDKEEDKYLYYNVVMDERYY